MDDRYILVINSGSSSIKYQLFDMDGPKVLATGLTERIGENEGLLRHRLRVNDGGFKESETTSMIPDHRAGLDLIFQHLSETGILGDIKALSGIGHRVVHGGEHFNAPALIDETVLDAIRETAVLAPLHNPANLTGIEVAMTLCPNTPQVAVFDTAFHQTMPPCAYRYALPHDWYSNHQVRRYGFHGTSHAYVARRAAVVLERPLDALNLISMHLGNGASITAIQGGRSIDTSMGMTPLEGLVMGTRSGDIDPSIPGYMAQHTALSIGEVEDNLNRQSGLKGLCGVGDMREVMQLADTGNPQALEAIDVYCYRIRKYIGAYTAILGRVDALIFTGGIGENASRIRAQVCEGLEGLGVRIDVNRNETAMDTTQIHSGESNTAVLVIPTNEELEIAKQTLQTLHETP